MPELIPAAPGTPEWQAARRTGVTATDIVTILGLTTWNSAYSLFWQKMGQVPEAEDSDRFRLGRELEPYIMARWQEANPDLPLSGSGLWRHVDHSWQMATLDRFVWDSPQALNDMTSKPAAVLELKSWADADRRAWGPGNTRDEDILIVGEALIPPQVRAQVLWQMDVMDVAAGHVGVVFLPSGEFRSYTIEHQPEYHGDLVDDIPAVLRDGLPACTACADQMLMRDSGWLFMRRLRLELPPPDPDSSAATLAAVRARFTRQPDKTAEINADVWYAFEQARDDLDAAKAEAHLWEINVREQAGEASVYTVDGRPVARRIVSDAQVKAHTRHADYLRRITPRGDDSE